MNYITLIRLGGTNIDRQELRQAVGLKLVEDLKSRCKGPAKYTLLLGIDEPKEMNLHREGDDFSPPFDIAIKAVSENPSTLLETIRQNPQFDRLADWGVYGVEETIKKDRNEPWSDGENPGIHMLHPLYFHDDLSQEAIDRSWGMIHAELAVKVHVGGNMYHQHRVKGAITSGSQADFNGFSEFHFPTKDDLVNGYFDSDRGRMEIRHDIRHFIKGFPARLFARELRFSK